MVRRKSSVALGQRSLADILTNKTIRTTHCGKRSKGLARVNLTRWSDRLNAGSPVHMRSTISSVPGYWISELVITTGMAGNRHTQLAGQAFHGPSHLATEFRQRAR